MTGRKFNAYETLKVLLAEWSEPLTTRLKTWVLVVTKWSVRFKWGVGSAHMPHSF